MRRFAIALLTCVFALLMLCPAAVSAAAPKVVLYDEGDRLDEAQEQECIERLQQAANKTGMNIGVVLGIQKRSDIAIDSAAKESYLSLFGENSDGLLYYMDLKGQDPYDRIVTRGKAQFYYTNSSDNNRIDMIFDTLDKYLYPVGKEDVRGAVLAFAEEVEYFYDRGVPDRYYYYDDEYRMYYSLDDDGNVRATVNKPYKDWGALIGLTILACICGIIAALIFFFVIKSKYKFKYALSPTTYINKKTVQFYNQYDNFVRSHTTKVSIDSGSGGRSGGGGGGGHSSGGFGGGGHHR